MANIRRQAGDVFVDGPAVNEASWRLSATDIARGDGIATVTLRSGAQLTGSVDLMLSEHEVLHLKVDRGWVSIDWTEIAALAGQPKPRGR